MTNQSTEEKTKTTGIKKVLLKDLGPNLPCGISGDKGALLKPFGVRRWRMVEERALGDMRDENREASVAQFVSLVLSSMLTSLGPHDFEKLGQPQKLLQISQMRIGDVFYAYMWLRTRALGNELQLTLPCPKCKDNFSFTADLNTVEVNTVDSVEDAMWDYYLADPFKIRDENVIGFRLGPPRWSALEGMKGMGGMNTGAAKAGVILGTIQGIIVDRSEGPKLFALAPSEIDEMSKLDIETLTSQLDAHALGPDMVVECKCPKPSCKADVKAQIDWGYDSFFGISSQ